MSPIFRPFGQAASSCFLLESVEYCNTRCDIYSRLPCAAAWDAPTCKNERTVKIRGSPGSNVAR